MKIAVLGANGFVGSNIAKSLNRHHTVQAITRSTIDLLDGLAVGRWLETERYDCVINAAAVMKDDRGIDDTRNNLGIFMNFYTLRNLYGKFINMASGAEYDRARNINCAREFEIFSHMPQDSYGFGQNMKSRLSAVTPGFYNLRIFNCFGRGEIQTRIFPRLLAVSQFTVSNDRYFDFFSIQDLLSVVEHFVENDVTVKDVNCVYDTKLLISQAVELFCHVRQLNPKISVVSCSSNNYTGSHDNLYSLNIELQGLEQGFKDYE